MLVDIDSGESGQVVCCEAWLLDTKCLQSLAFLVGLALGGDRSAGLSCHHALENRSETFFLSVVSDLVHALVRDRDIVRGEESVGFRAYVGSQVEGRKGRGFRRSLLRRHGASCAGLLGFEPSSADRCGCIAGASWYHLHYS